MTRSVHSVVIAFLASLLLATGAAAQSSKPHLVVIQVDQNDPDVMNLALNNAKNMMDYYADKKEDIKIEIVAYSGGLNMLRADTSPVKDRIKQMSEATPSKIAFAACNNTKKAMEAHEGHPITIIPQATVVPSGAVRIVQLEEEGYSFLKP